MDKVWKKSLPDAHHKTLEFTWSRECLKDPQHNLWITNILLNRVNKTNAEYRFEDWKSKHILKVD